MKLLHHIKSISIFVVFGLAMPIQIFGQAYQDYLSISGDQNAANLPGNPLENKACKEIRLQPGYRFAANANQSMRTYIDPNLTCDVNYVPGFSFTPLPQVNPSFEVGTTPGSFAVTQTGAATYNIPLVVSPGTAGMHPNLSIQHNSQRGEGLLGIGWDLTGLSAITRTGRTLYHDGSIAPVTLTSNDRFIFDGVRLMVATGNYGDNGAQYGTEVESFSRITSFDVAGINGPGWFKVDTKNGTTLEFGNTTDSRIEASGGSSTVLSWLLNKVTDVRGNYMEVTYFENNNTGEFRPIRIDYTRNDFAGLTQHYNQVKFNYNARAAADRQVAYVAGHQVQQNVLLTGIEMYALGAKMHSYEFNYSLAMNMSHLSEVIEKGSDNKQFNSTKFIWYSSDINPELVSFPSSFDGDNISTLDFDGDGFTDIVSSSGNSQWHSYKNNDNGTFSPTGTTTLTDSDHPSGIQFSRLTGQISNDFTGDGYDDMVLMGLSENDGGTLFHNEQDEDFKLYFLKSTEVNGARYLAVDNSNSFTFNWTQDDKAKFKYTVGDFNGDGATDLFFYFYDADQGYIHTFTNGHTELVLGDVGDRTLKFYTVNLDGDSKQEILYTYQSHSEVLSFNGNDLVGISGSMGYPTGFHRIYPGDFNGDGKTDLLTWTNPNQGGGGWRVGYSLGDNHNFFEPAQAIIQSFGDPDVASNFHEYVVADFNGDGKADILDKGVVAGTGPTYIDIKYSTGRDFVSGSFNTVSSGPPALNRISGDILGDFDGDGHMGIVYKQGNTSTWWQFKFMPHDDIHKIQGIINGLGHRTSLSQSTLASLTTGTPHYFKDNTALYPVIDFQKALKVVRTVFSDNGLGTLNATTYVYEGAKVHLTGKGFLGFTKVKTVDLAAGMTQVNTYETGMSWLLSNFFQPVLTSSATYLSSFLTLGQIVNEKIMNPADYTFKKGPNLPIADVPGGKRYSFFVDHMTDIDHLHGNTNLTDIIQDNFGNIESQTISNAAGSATTDNVY